MVCTSGEIEVAITEGVEEGDEFDVQVPLDDTAPDSDSEGPADATAPEPAQSIDEFDTLASIMAEVEVSSDDSSSSSGDVDLDALLDM